MAKRFSVEAVFRAVDRLTAPISRMQNRVQKFTRGMRRGLFGVNRALGRVTSGLKKVGLAAVASLSLVGVAFGNILGAGADFEQAITNVGAVTLQTRNQIADLEQEALRLGKTTKFTATQAANAMQTMARAGFTAQQTLKATPTVLSAAAASGLEIAEVAGIVSKALKGMGLGMSEVARVSDVLVLASSKTDSTIGSLGESLKNVATTAKRLNIPFEEVVAAIALLQDIGLDASVAGSAFNVMLTKMAAPTKSITKQMKKFGITFKDGKGNMLPFQKVLEQLSIASKKAGGNFDKVAFLAELVGLRGQKAAASLTDLFESGQLGTLSEDLREAFGISDKMASIRMDTMKGSLLLLNSAVEGVKVSIFDLSGGALRELVDRMTKWVGVNGELISQNVGGFLLKVVDNFDEIVAAIKSVGKTLIIFFGLITVIKALTIAVGLFNVIVALNPLVLMAIGVTALIAGFVALIGWTDKMIGSFESLPGVLRFILTPLELMIRAIKFVSDNIGTVIEGVGALSKVGSFLGFGGDDDSLQAGGGKVNPSIVTPQERVASSIQESNTTNTSEVTIKAENGVAEVTGGKLGNGLTLQPSGAF